MREVIEEADIRDIPVLTDEVEESVRSTAFDTKAVHAAVVSETTQLAASLLHQATKDIEAILFERVLDRLRAQLPELVDRVLREHASPPTDAPADPVEPGNTSD